MSKTRRVPQRARAIRRLAKLRETFGPDAAAERERLLRACGRASCRSGKELSSLHETLCFARAYPDNQAVLDLVQDLLDRWERRADVHALGEALQGLGMAGVANAYPFFWPTARWLAERWPGALHVDWDNLEDADGVASLLKLLMPRAESPALEELPLTARQWVRHLKRDDEGDGTFLVRRFAEASMDERWREEVFDSLDVPFVLTPARGTPSRTTSFIAGLPLCWQTHARSTARPDLKREIERPPKRMRHVNHKHGAELVDAARVAMLTRERDLEQIAYAYRGRRLDPRGRRRAVLRGPRQGARAPLRARGHLRLSRGQERRACGLPAGQRARRLGRDQLQHLPAVARARRLPRSTRAASPSSTRSNTCRRSSSIPTSSARTTRRPSSRARGGSITSSAFARAIGRRARWRCASKSA